jgi:hypothetical protein
MVFVVARYGFVGPRDRSGRVYVRHATPFDGAL